MKPKPPEPVDEYKYIVPDTVMVVPVNRRTRTRVNARHGTQVLIIDDSPVIVASLGKALRSANYLVLEATNAESGLELARSERPNLIFMDIMLPGMNGFSALRKIRRDVDLVDIPVIMISGNEKAIEYFFSNRVNADDFMKKPFSREEIFARIERLLDKSRVPRRPIVTDGFDKVPLTHPTSELVS
ncbi:MAG TPA: response regulator [Rhodocyclaceae bacterium]|nr:response regulator [Rhodocyclaceae bacterium]